VSIEPIYLSIDKLFHSAFVFRVPKYQRNYAWDEEQINDFLEDLMKCYESAKSGNRRHHFFGGIVSIEKSVTGSSRSDCEIVDGQQRLATFIILMSRVIKICEELQREATASNDHDNKDLAQSRIPRLQETYLIFKDEINRKPITLDKVELSGPDQRFFKDLLYNVTPPPVPNRESHNRLLDAFERLEKNLRDILSTKSSIGDRLDILKAIEDILIEDFTVIHITTESKGEAYRLFQVLNNRGMSLTAGDLLRSSTLELLDNPTFTNQQDSAEATWDNILSPQPEITEAFLRTYFSSVHGKRPSRVKLQIKE